MRPPDDFEGISCDGQLLHGGFIQVPTKILLDDRISPGAVKAYCILLYYNFRHHRYPGHEQAARDFSITPRTLRRHLAELEDIGHVVKVRRGRGQPNCYYLPQPQLIPYEDAALLPAEAEEIEYFEQFGR